MYQLILSTFVALLIFSNPALSATAKKSANTSQNMTAAECAVASVEDASKASSIVTQCTHYFADFAKMLVEGVGSSSLVGCRLVSDGTARLKSDPFTVLGKGVPIAVYISSPIVEEGIKGGRLESLIFPWEKSDKDCEGWRERAEKSRVDNPVPPRQ
ncbi:hypothetical protein K9M47_04370 [Candidatus Gracilibacteria bacterium]|nr:hypothetical protein [Candidatus Gracilibacteria bacterium]